MRIGLKVRGKIVATIIVVLSLCGVLLYLLIYTNLRSNGQEEIAAFKREELIKVKKNLKNYVDIAFEVLDANYKKSRATEYIKEHYGQRLRDIIDVASAIVDENILLSKSGAISE